MGWFSCSHIWSPVSVHHYRDTSHSKFGISSTNITNKCSKCGEIKSTNHYGAGFITLDALKAAPVKIKTQPSYLKIIK